MRRRAAGFSPRLKREWGERRRERSLHYMTAQIIKGAEIAKEIRAELKTKVDELKKKGITPGLFIIRVGEDPASVSYVTAKTKASEELGILSETLVYPVNTKEEVILAKIEALNKDPKWN